MITKMFPVPLVKPSLAVSMLVPVLLLSGCGGSESDNAGGSANAPVVEPAPVSARDGFNVVTPDAPSYVDLSSLIESGTAGAKVTSVYLESKQGTGDCGQVLSSSEASGDSTNANIILGQGFNVTIDGAAICEYTYEVESVALAGQTKTRARAKVMVASSAGGTAVLPPISIAMAIDDLPRVTDIKAELEAKGSFPTGYILSEDFSVLGDGDVMVDAAGLSVSYSPTAEGVSRVVYALESVDPDAPDIKMGTLDYAVSDSLNSAPTAKNFAYDTKVEINTSVDIDVSDYIDAVDSDQLQLIEVKSYTGNVVSTAPGDLTNKVFTFEATKPGEHFISYMVSDQRGGFATGIVDVTVFDPDQIARWTGIENGLHYFTAPQTKSEIDDTGDEYQGFFEETSYTPTLKIATFTFEGAETYCGNRGRLPTPAEMSALYLDRSPKDVWLWPVEKQYVTKDGSTPGLYSLKTGTATNLSTDLYYATCIDSGGLNLIVDKGVAVANALDSIQLRVSFIRDTGPVNDQVLDIRLAGVSGDTAIPNVSTVTTDESGLASFAITNTKSGITNISLEYTNLSSELVSVNTSVNFIGDLDTARIASVEVISDTATHDGTDQNLFEVTILDDYDNLTLGAEVGVVHNSATAKSVPGDFISSDNGLVQFGATDTIEETVLTTVSFTSVLTGYSEQTASNSYGTCKTIKLNGLRYSCPLKQKRADELGFSYDGVIMASNSGPSYGSIFIRNFWENANNACKAQGKRLATKDELLALYAAYPSMLLTREKGWPVRDHGYWTSSSEPSVHGYYYGVMLSSGGYGNYQGSSNFGYSACVY